MLEGLGLMVVEGRTLGVGFCLAGLSVSDKLIPLDFGDLVVPAWMVFLGLLG